MSEWKSILVPDEAKIEGVMNLKLTLAFVPVGEPMQNAAPREDGRLILTNRRLIVQWTDQRVKLYFTLAVYALSERFFSPSQPNWPYQAILILPGGMNLIVETLNRDSQSANILSQFLNRVLFSLGKRDTDIASMAAINAYLEELRRQDSARRDETTTTDDKNR
jgi:hypothetical protein